MASPNSESDDNTLPRGRGFETGLSRELTGVS